MASYRTLTVVVSLALVSAYAVGQSRKTLQEAPLDRSVTLPYEELVQLYRDAGAEYISTTRLLEGGLYNVNIRHVQNVTPENFTTLIHEDTIDVWVVQEGSGTMITGGTKDGDRQIGGEERFISVGDLVFIPAGVPHGMKETSSITWLNIRFPEHRN